MIKTEKEETNKEDVENTGENITQNKAVNFIKYKNRKKQFNNRRETLANISSEEETKETLIKKEVKKEVIEKNNSKNMDNIKYNIRENSKEAVRSILEEGESTDDVGTKSTVGLERKYRDIQAINKNISSRFERRGISSQVNKDQAETKIKTQVDKNIQNQIANKRKEEVIKKSTRKIKTTSAIKKQESAKKGVKAIGEALKSLGKAKAGGILALISIIFFLLMVSSTGNGTTTTPSFYIFTSDEQNEAYLSHYEDLKVSLEEEIEGLIDMAMTEYDDVIVHGLSPDGKVYDLDFTEWISILAVEIEQNYKLASYEYQYLKEIFNKMIYYETLEEKYIETRTEIRTEIDEDGNEITIEEEIEEEKIRLIITVYNKSYEEIKHDLGFDEEQLEWVERLIEYDSLRDRIEDMPTSDSFIDSQGKLSDEEIEKYGGKMVHPTNGVGVVTSEYGYRIHPIDKTTKFHSGIDIGGNDKAPIFAAQSGKVIFAGNRGGYGLTVIIQHDDGLVTLYAHCSSLSVTQGQSVEKGEHISNVGNTGNSTGPHLHFEIRKGVDGETINPRNFL